jgi:cytochrome P450
LILAGYPANVDDGMSVQTKTASAWPGGIFTSRYPFGATTLVPDVRAGREFRRDPLTFLIERGEQRSVFRFKLGFTEYVLVNDPALIRRILIDDAEKFGEGKWSQRGFHVMGDCLITREGEPHLQRRASLREAFGRSGIEAASPHILEVAERMDARWTDGTTIDVKAEMAHMSLVASVLALFGEDLEAEADDLYSALATLIYMVSRLPIPRRRVARAHALVRPVARRLADGAIGDSLRKEGIGEDKIIDELVSLLMGTVDTTPTALAWCWEELARNPEAEARVHEELSDSTRLDGSRSLEAADSPYLRQVVTETLRLHPSVHFIDRRALEDVELGGVRVRAGDYVLLCPLLTHRDPRFYAEPERYSPERWGTGDGGPTERFAYFPFGGGPHVCIGMGLAVQEISVFLAVLARRWRLRSVDARETDLYATNLRMRVEARR